MKNWFLLILVFAVAVGCGCDRKEETKKQANKDNLQQSNTQAEGYQKSRDNSYGGLPTTEVNSNNSKECLDLGETANQPGPREGAKLVRECCEGLVDRESVDMCGKGIAGGYIYACIQCGDGTCDPNNESKCNCPEDCK